MKRVRTVVNERLDHPDFDAIVPLIEEYVIGGMSAISAGSGGGGVGSPGLTLTVGGGIQAVGITLAPLWFDTAGKFLVNHPQFTVDLSNIQNQDGAIIWGRVAAIQTPTQTEDRVIITGGIETVTATEVRYIDSIETKLTTGGVLLPGTGWAKIMTVNDWSDGLPNLDEVIPSMLFDIPADDHGPDHVELLTFRAFIDKVLGAIRDATWKGDASFDDQNWDDLGSLRSLYELDADLSDVEGDYLPLAGGSMTGDITMASGDISMSTNSSLNTNEIRAVGATIEIKDRVQFESDVVMKGDVDMGGNHITDVNTVDGVDLGGTVPRLFALANIVPIAMGRFEWKGAANGYTRVHHVNMPSHSSVLADGTSQIRIGTSSGDTLLGFNGVNIDDFVEPGGPVIDTNVIYSVVATSVQWPGSDSAGNGARLMHAKIVNVSIGAIGGSYNIEVQPYTIDDEPSKDGAHFDVIVYGLRKA